MTKAIEKMDRFLERYKQLCLEEGLFITTESGDMYLEFINSNHMEPFEDSIDEIRNVTIDEMNWDKKWKALDK